MTTTSEKQVVIVGAGHRGLRTALKLEGLLKTKEDWRILLVDQYGYYQLKTEL